MFKNLPCFGYFLAVLLTTTVIAQINNDNPAILILGDSLSAGYGLNTQQGWVSLLQNRLDNSGYHYRVINASVSGDTSGGGLARLPKVLSQYQPEITIVELGGNDGLRGQPIKSIYDNLSAIIKLCKQNNSTVVLLGMQIPPNYGRTYTQKFSELYSSLADQHQLSLVPFFLDEVATKPDLMQEDQIHPTAAAQSLLLDNVWTILNTVLDENNKTQ